jgi:succinate dehydrogenase flavin-adding protein (antitoxin of CptAB toxin-antitoxin module)
MLELDLVLNAFVGRGLERLDERQVEAFAELLDYPDQVLLDLVMRRAEPEDPAVRGVLELVRGA